MCSCPFARNPLETAPPNFKIGRFIVPALPTRFTVGAKNASEDIAENRAIKTCLLGWKEWLLAIANLLSDPSQITDMTVRDSRLRWSRRSQSLAGRLSRLLDLPLFENVSNKGNHVSPSPIFQRVPHYHEFLSLYRDINLGMAQIEGDFLNLPLSRTYELYELWVFLRICRAATLKYGLNDPLTQFFEPDRTRLGVASLIANPSLTIKPGVQLHFKRQYREFWRNERNIGSFSRTMIPDISIEKFQESPLIIVLDAKYRIENQLNDALSSIHMYRDAIVQDRDPGLQKIVVASYLVTPHSPPIALDWKGSEMPARCFTRLIGLGFILEPLPFAQEVR